MNGRFRISKEALYFKFPTLLADICIQLAVLWGIMYGTDMIREGNMLIYEKSGTIVLLVLSTVLSAFILGIHLNERNNNTFRIIWLSSLYSFVSWMLFNGLMAIIYELTLQGWTLALQLVLTTTLIVISHLSIRFLIERIRLRGTNNYTIVMIGSASNLNTIYLNLKEDRTNGYKLLGFFTDNKDEIPEGATFMGAIQDCFSYLTENAKTTKEVLCSLNPATEYETVNRIVNLCDSLMIRFKYVPDMRGYPRRSMTFSKIGNVNVISLHEEPMNRPWARILKRSMDIVVSALFLILVFPFVWLFAAIGIKFSSPGPVFFKQRRTGYEGKEFDCLKFRSMHMNNDADTKQAVKGDSRVFPFGEFLRKTSIDELPQFINVLKGDMSIIGPRPHMLHHTDIYSELIGDYMVRHYAKPGITGWAQVNGSRGETKEVSEMKKRVELDIWYIENWSIGLDISIFFMTVWQLLKGGGEKAY